jgi:hypothetical protein
MQCGSDYSGGASMQQAFTTAVMLYSVSMRAPNLTKHQSLVHSISSAVTAEYVYAIALAVAVHALFRMISMHRAHTNTSVVYYEYY